MSSCQESQLVGIARLASESQRLSEKKQVTYFELEAKSILNRCSNKEMPFYWTINPYRGCEFGCKYCYARYTHEYMGMEDGAEFERKIYSKKDAYHVLDEELSAAKLRNRPVAIGTATDPYQPAERKFFTTRSLLEALAKRQRVALSITTKSDLVVRDVDLLKQIQKQGTIHVNISITTLKPRLARLLEPKAATPKRRLAAVEGLAAHGIPVGVFIMPVIPMLTDDLTGLDEIAKQAKAAGAGYLAARPLFLMPSAQKVFLPFIEEKFPRLLPAYRKLFGSSAYLPEAYGLRIRKQMDAIRQKHQLPSHPPEDLPWVSGASPEQATLPFTAPIQIQRERPGSTGGSYGAKQPAETRTRTGDADQRR
ncbi:MAG: radical SAM protein [Acidobacteria bacterium]|nr:radical SAM protein [Acidobacteriota bacterium]